MRKQAVAAEYFVFVARGRPLILRTLRRLQADQLGQQGVKTLAVAGVQVDPADLFNQPLKRLPDRPEREPAGREPTPGPGCARPGVALGRTPPN
jgi:hypothetical protein